MHSPRSSGVSTSPSEEELLQRPTNKGISGHGQSPTGDTQPNTEIGSEVHNTATTGNVQEDAVGYQQEILGWGASSSANEVGKQASERNHKAVSAGRSGRETSSSGLHGSSRWVRNRLANGDSSSSSGLSEKGMESGGDMVETATPATATLLQKRLERASTKPIPLGVFQRMPRTSRLDICDSSSDICKSQFAGILNLCTIIAGIHLVAGPLINFYEKGYLFETALARNAFTPTIALLSTWGFCIGWSYTAYGLFRLYEAGKIGRKTTRVLQHTSQAILICGTVVKAVLRNWTLFPCTFALTVALCHYMKMHSYLDYTMDLMNASSEMREKIGFPMKCTMKNFTRFLFLPILVYEIDYPTSQQPFRIKYFFLKALHLIGTMTLIYLVASTMIVPVFEEAYRFSFLHSWARMIIPLLLMDFLFFYMMFECILNMLAELTGFADREFYEDWWNCTTWEENARKWNKPVHEFLLRHVYLKFYRGTKASKFWAALLTFFFSAILHEMFLSVCLKVVKGWMFGLMMCQIPLIFLSSHLTKNTWHGNLIYWFGLSLGVPLLCTTYGREWAAKNGFIFTR